MNYRNISSPLGHRIAYRYREGRSALPPIVFLCGFKSDMDGSKAQWLDQYCRETDRTFLRFDYFSHGRSDGDFMDFTIGTAIKDAQFMIQSFINRPAIVIGSSMGGWVGLRLLEIIPERIFGFIGIAAAPDFTAELLHGADQAKMNALRQDGYFTEPSGYEEPYIFTLRLLEDGREHCALHRRIDTDKPVILLQGKFDASVPWQKAERIKAALNGKAVIHYIEDGDHSLSRLQDLTVLKSAIEEMSA